MRWRLFAVALLPVVAVPLAAARPGSSPIDLSQGVVDGRTALSFWATDGWDGEELLDPAGLAVHLAPLDRLGEERVYPAGTWIAPPPGAYRYWIEGRGRMSPVAEIVRYAGKPFRGRGLASVRPVVPAGTVALPPQAALRPGTELRLLHVDSHNGGPGPRLEMSRRAAGDAALAGVAMPAGPVVAGLYDTRRERYVALAPPVRVRPGEQALVLPQAPRNAALVVLLERPRVVTRFEEYDVEVEAVGTEGRVHRPDVVVPTASRTYALWLDLDEAFVDLRVRSPSVFLAPEKLMLRHGGVLRHQARLRPLPALEVSVRLPPEWPAGCGPGSSSASERPAASWPAPPSTRCAPPTASPP